MPAETAAAYAAPGYLLLRVAGGARRVPVRCRARDRDWRADTGGTVGRDGRTESSHSAFSVSAAGVLAHRPGAGSRRQLAWVDRTGKTLGAIGPPDENAPANPELAPDGQRVAIGRDVQGNNDVWLIEAGRGVAGRFTFDDAIDTGAHWSPDGRHVVFRSTRNGVYDLFEKPASGAADEQPLLVTSQAKAPLDWSRDGRFLLYSTQDPKTASDLWALPLMGERKPFAVLQSSFDEIEGQFSPDGRWLAYASNESGRYEILLHPNVSGGGCEVAGLGGWRRAAALAAGRPGTQPRGAGHPADGGAGPVVAGRTHVGGRRACRTLSDAARHGRKYCWHRVPGSSAVCRRGRRPILMNIAADDAVVSPITVVQNWTTGLKK